ncbi:hypothetical protein BJ742DRAFT_428615 [Cladochytrium replicatum]|nr:hypothetical protein BJ742DRAFT_428615 [Cladochytrium replicatum]
MSFRPRRPDSLAAVVRNPVTSVHCPPKDSGGRALPRVTVFLVERVQCCPKSVLQAKKRLKLSALVHFNGISKNDPSVTLPSVRVPPPPLPLLSSRKGAVRVICVVRLLRWTNSPSTRALVVFGNCLVGRSSSSRPDAIRCPTGTRLVSNIQLLRKSKWHVSSYTHHILCPVRYHQKAREAIMLLRTRMMTRRTMQSPWRNIFYNIFVFDHVRLFY